MTTGPLPAGILQLQDMIQRVINLSTALAAIALTVMLVVGAIKYLTSGGEPKPLASANNTLTWALLGFVFLALAWIILVVIKNFTGVDVTHFCLKFEGC